MKIHKLRRSMVIPERPEPVWEFFSSPRNLPRITPAEMKFQITSISGEGLMHPGQIISYRVSVFPGVRLTWVTEITHVSKYQYFVDEQRFGPYAFWHHKHFFRAVSNGTEMIDEVDYALPFGWLGRPFTKFVNRELDKIFSYRTQRINELFNH